jgi:hypothetical protein
VEISLRLTTLPERLDGTAVALQGKSRVGKRDIFHFMFALITPISMIAGNNMDATS